MSIILPSIYDPSANQFNRSVVNGSFIVQDKYPSYDEFGLPLDNRTAIGNSIFYGNVTVKGNTTFEKNITLPSVNYSLPSQTQLGGVFTERLETNMTSQMLNTMKTYGSLSLPAGCYIVFFNLMFYNINPPGTGVNVDLSNVSCGISTVNNSIVPSGNKNLATYTQILGNGGSTTTYGVNFYQHNNLTNTTIYLNSFMTATGVLRIVSNFKAIKVG